MVLIVPPRWLVHRLSGSFSHVFYLYTYIHIYIYIYIYIRADRRGQGGPDDQDGPATLQNDEKLKFDKGTDKGTREKSGWNFLEFPGIPSIGFQASFHMVFVWL